MRRERNSSQRDYGWTGWGIRYIRAKSRDSSILVSAGLFFLRGMDCALVVNIWGKPDVRMVPLPAFSFSLSLGVVCVCVLRSRKIFMLETFKPNVGTSPEALWESAWSQWCWFGSEHSHRLDWEGCWSHSRTGDTHQEFGRAIVTTMSLLKWKSSQESLLNGGRKFCLWKLASASLCQLLWVVALGS